MKKIKLNSSRLRLKKESIVNLTDKEQNAINGGHTASGDPKCGHPNNTGLQCPVQPYPHPITSPTYYCPGTDTLLNCPTSDD
jgi:hypothetical protein